MPQFMIKYIAAGVIFSQYLFSANAQTVVKESPDQDWRIIPGSYNKMLPSWPIVMYPTFKTSDGDFKSSIVNLSETEVAALISFKGNSYGVMKLNENLKTVWTTPIPGEPYYLFKFFDNLLVVSSTGKGFKPATDIFLIDAKTGKLLKRKPWLEQVQEQEQTTLWHPVTSNNSRDYRLVIRSFEKKDRRAINGLHIATFDKDLEVVSIDKIPILNGGDFINCALNDAGDLMVLSENNGQLIGQCFTAKTWVPKEKVAVPFNARNKSKFSAQIRPSLQAGNIAYTIVAYKNEEKDEVSSVIKMDFNTGKFFSNDITLNKNFYKAVKSKYSAPKDFDKPDFGDWDNLKFIDLVEVGDKVAILREVRLSYESSSRTYWYTGDALFSLLSDKMENTGDIIIPKRFRLNGPVGISSAIQVKNNNVYFVSGYDRGAGRKALVAKIDPVSAQIKFMEEIKKTDIKGGYPADPQATLWFKNSFVISYLDADATMLRIVRIQANLQQVSY